MTGYFQGFRRARRQTLVLSKRLSGFLHLIPPKPLVGCTTWAGKAHLSLCLINARLASDEPNPFNGLSFRRGFEMVVLRWGEKSKDILPLGIIEVCHGSEVRQVDLVPEFDFALISVD